MRVLIATALLAVAAASGRAGLGGRGVGVVGRGNGGYGGGYGYGGYGGGYGYGGHAGRGGRGGRGGYGNDYNEPRPYHYQYAVDDPHYGPMFNKEEQSDGAGTVQGYYAVNLPDGRTQHVKYVSDHYNGFNAEVTYDGYANHPQVARGYGYGGGSGAGRAGGRGGRRGQGSGYEYRPTYGRH